MAQATSPAQGNENYYRLVSLVYDALLPAVQGVIHNDNTSPPDPSYQGLPRDPATLYTLLSTKYKQTIIKMYKSGLVKPDQYDLLLPNNQKTYSTLFDMTLSVLVIRRIINLPRKSWDAASLKPSDRSIPANIIRSRELRNYLSHGCKPSTFDLQTLNTKWKEGEQIVADLKYSIDLNDLFIRPLDGQKMVRLEAFVDNLNQKIDNVQLQTNIAMAKANEELNEKIDNIQLDVEILAKTVENIKLQTSQTETKEEGEFEKVEETIENITQQFGRIEEICRHIEETDSTMEELGKIKTVEEKLEEFSTFQNLFKEATFTYSYDEPEEYIIEELVDFQGNIIILDESINFQRSITKTNVRCTIRFLTPGEHYTLTVKLKPKKKDRYFTRRIVKKFVAEDDESKPHCWKHNIAGSKCSVMLAIHHAKTNLNILVNSNEEIKPKELLDVPKYRETFPLSKWKKECRRNFKENYKREINTDAYIQCENPFYKCITKWWIENFKSFDSPSIFTNYNPVDHAKFYLNDIEQLGKKLYIDWNSYKHCVTSVVIYDVNRSTLVYIRLTNEINKDELKADIESLSTDVKILYELHRSSFECSGVGLTITGVLALRNVTESQLNDCVPCKNCNYLTKEQLHNSDLFNVWWRSLLKNCEKKVVDKSDNRCHEELCTSILGYLPIHFDELPGIKDNAVTKISKLLFTDDQKEIISSQEKKLFISGTYGTGKSLVAQHKLKQICETAVVPTSIYYLCGDSNSMLVHEMEDFVSSLKEQLCSNRKTIRIITGDDEPVQSDDSICVHVMTIEDFGVHKSTKTPVRLVDIIKKMDEENRDVHLVLDEYNGHDLKANDALEINNIISRKNLEQASLIIVTQPMSVHRSIHVKDKTTDFRTGYHYDETGMITINIGTSIRNPICIARVFRAAIDVINGEDGKTKSPLPAAIDRENNSIIESLAPENKKLSSDHDDKQSNPKFLSKITRGLFRKNVQRKNEINTTDWITPEPPRKQKELKTVDQLLQAIHSSSENFNDQSTITNNFAIVEIDRYGHKIHGHKPLIIRPFPNGIASPNKVHEMKFEDVHHLKLGFEFLNIEISTVIACSSAFEAEMCKQALEKGNLTVDVYTPGLVANDRLHRKCSSQSLRRNIVITDYSGIRGLDLESVIVTLSTTVSENFLAPFLLESLSRSFGSLNFIVFDYNDEEQNMDIHNLTQRLITRWEEKKLVKKRQVKCDLDHKFDKTNINCQRKCRNKKVKIIPSERYLKVRTQMGINISDFNQIINEEKCFKPLDPKKPTTEVLESKDETDKRYKYDDFLYLKIINKGSFAKTMLAHRKGTDEFYAIKIKKKATINNANYIFTEKRILIKSFDHPFILSLYSCFQTHDRVYYVLEYVNAGDLLFHLQRDGIFTEERARFYSAEIVLALQFLHKNNIICRDVKLDNISLDGDGHIKLMDFDVSKDRMDIHGLTNTFCGTRIYIAPEIILGKDYSYSVDWWSLGILIYEMVIGQSPFKGKNQEEHFASISKDSVTYPKAWNKEAWISKEVKSIIEGLLEKDPDIRLGCVPGVGDVAINKHPFFHSFINEYNEHVFYAAIDWDKLKRREIKPPFRPQVKCITDVSSFDRELINEKPILTPTDDTELEGINQNQFFGFSYVHPSFG